MESWVVEKFLGLQNDMLGVASPPGVAEIAYDIDFRAVRGRLQGLKSPTAINSRGTISSMCAFGGSIINSIATTLYNGNTQIKASWGGVFSHTIIETQLILVNGSQPIKYNGSNVYNVGIAEPSQAAMTAAATGTNAFQVDDWDYCVTFVNGDGFESNPDDLHATTNITTASGQGAGKASCDLANIPLGAAADNVTARKLYRTLDGGSIYYYLDTISDNTTTTYVDTTIDANLGSTIPPTNHDVPPSDLVLIAEAGGRLLGVPSSDRTKLYYSLPSATNWEGWPSTYYTVFPDNIRGLGKVGERTIVITESAPHAFLMPTNNINSFYDRELDYKEPTKSGQSLARLGDILLFRGTRGIYFTDGVQVQFLSHLQEGLFDVITTTQVLAASETTVYYVAADIVFAEETGTPVKFADAQGNDYVFSSELGVVIDMDNDDTYTFSAELGVIADLSSDATTSEVLLVDMDYEKIHSVMREGYISFAHDYQNNVMYAGDDVGVWQLFAGSPSAWQWRSGWSWLGFPSHWKRLDKCYFYVNGQVTLNIYLDNSETAAFSETFNTTSMELQDNVTLPPTLWCHTASIEFIASTGAAVDPPFALFFETRRMDKTRQYA